jgi:hypothetical protein
MVVLLLVAAAPQAHAQRRWGVEIGHSYSSAKALHQPATFALNVADSITTDVQGGVLVGGPIGSSASLEFGLRALAGSARSKAESEYGAIVRGFVRMGQWVSALSGEYEADGGFDVQKGVIGAEVTPLGEMRWCLGVRCARSRLQWRPWLGVGVGNSFRGARELAAPEGRTFVRVYLRGEASWVPRENLEVNLEATGWYLARGSRGRTNTTASVAYEVWKGFSLTAKGQVGSPPPRFDYSRSLSVGLGFVLRRDGEAAALGSADSR